MNKFNLVMVSVASLALLPAAALAQSGEAGLTTQVLVHGDSKADGPLDATTIKLQVESKTVPLKSLVPVSPNAVQMALLIDDGLSRSAGIQLQDLKAFVGMVPPGVELLVGYMSNGTVRVESGFSTDRAAAAAAIRLPSGIAGESASPYFCLSDFVKRWPGQGAAGKARVVMMLTNGVDLYNGSTRLDNQDSPYVEAAARDAERAGVAVYSVYYRDAGFRGGGSAPLSGQSYLAQVAQETGGETYYQGDGSPVSLTPYLKEFLKAVSKTEVASFDVDPNAGGREHLVRLKMTTSVPKVKIRVADTVRPGNRESPGRDSGASM